LVKIIGATIGCNIIYTAFLPIVKCITWPKKMLTAKELVEFYEMLPHPEGGFYKEMYRSAEHISHSALPNRFGGDRSFSTAIYFLLEQGNFSAFHIIQSDEVWHFYAGAALNIYVIDKNGALSIIRLGNDVAKGELFQAVVPAGCWFASAPAKDSAFSFVGCTVAPGFDFNDFELADSSILAATYPQHKAVIESLCR
jgi:predicted cupin superfamily sugar epimerase